MSLVLACFFYFNREEEQPQWKTAALFGLWFCAWMGMLMLAAFPAVMAAVSSVIVTWILIAAGWLGLMKLGDRLLERRRREESEEYRVRRRRLDAAGAIDDYQQVIERQMALGIELEKVRRRIGADQALDDDYERQADYYRDRSLSLTAWGNSARAEEVKARLEAAHAHADELEAALERLFLDRLLFEIDREFMKRYRQRSAHR